MGALSPTHWLIVVGVVVLLFGAKRLPDAARSLGHSARILKAEVGEMSDQYKPADPAPPTSAVSSSTQQTTPATGQTGPTQTGPTQTAARGSGPR